MRKVFFLFILCFGVFKGVSQLNAYKIIETPEKIFGSLFKDVQNSSVFVDSKTFVDCVPKINAEEILKKYNQNKTNKDFNLAQFVNEYFIVPSSKNIDIANEKDVVKHITNLWALLKKNSDEKVAGASLLSLPNNYIVPGGRFREIYYWDSYFTMLGLKESNEIETIENMVNNFAFLINKYGHIPNGNRTYYLSRSQPPFFCMMVELLASIKGEMVFTKYLLPMQKEYNYWMEGQQNLKKNTAFKRVVKLADGTILNRYWDDLEIPRQEGYREDLKTAEEATLAKTMTMRFASEKAMNSFVLNNKKNIYKNLRAGACSGWDFSSRWFTEPDKIGTIKVLDIAPIDLNALMYKMEMLLSKAYKLTNKSAFYKKMYVLANKRKGNIMKYFYSNTLNFFSDYNFIDKQTTDIPTAAALFPLSILQIETKEQNELGVQAEKFILKYLLQEGGILTTPNNTGQQWDAPNGWAPLQWMCIKGLENTNQNKLAADIAMRWIKLNTKVFKSTNKLMEKYNVVNTQLESGGGEYPSQDGFGWTNGVLLALIKQYDKNKEYLK